MRWLLGGLLATSTLVMCSCSASTPAPPRSAPTVAPTSQPSPVASVPAVVGSPSPASQGQQAAVEAALREGSARLGVNQGDLKVDQVEARQWPDASLGCPRQGVLYAQVVTPGYLVVVSGSGKQLEYHADERGRVVLCSER